MAVENAGAVRHHPRAGHASAAAAGKTGAADAGEAPGGFLALLGAAEDLSDPSATGAGLLADAGTGGDAGLSAGGASLPGQAADPLVDDAATLAAWSGLLQAPLTPPAPAALPATSGAGAATLGTLASALGPDGAGQGGGRPGMAATLAAGNAPVASVAQATPPGAADPAQRAPLLATDAAAQSALASAATAATAGVTPDAASPPAPIHAFGATQQLRVASAARQAAASRAHVAATAALATTGTATATAAASSGTDTGALQQALVSVSSGSGTAGDADSRASRGVTSTVALGDGNPGRWAGLLSEISRSPQGEGGAGGFAGNGRHEAGAGGQDRAGDGFGGGAIGFAAAGSGSAGTGDASSSFSGGPGSDDSQGQGGSAGSFGPGGTVMSPDEWLAATTPALGSAGLQTAELTVDAFGSPVDVRVSLDGSSAEVTFQTDQADTRALLGDTVADLQSLMQQQGLVLSGVTVDGGRADGRPGADPAGGERRGEASRAARIDAPASTDTVTVAQARSRAAASRGGLDLFA